MDFFGTCKLPVVDAVFSFCNDLLKKETKSSNMNDVNYISYTPM